MSGWGGGVYEEEGLGKILESVKASLLKALDWFLKWHNEYIGMFNHLKYNGINSITQLKTGRYTTGYNNFTFVLPK